MKFELLDGDMNYGVDTIQVANQNYRIINLNDTSIQEYDRLLAEFDCKVPATFLKDLPFDSDYHFSSSTFADYQTLYPTGVHYSIGDGLESFKIFIPKGNAVVILGVQYPEWTECLKIELEFDEPKYDSIIEFSNGSQNSGSNSSVNIHTANETVDLHPHLDTQLGINLQHTKIELSKTQANAIVQKAGVIGNTYIDQSGRMYYIGDHYA